MLHQARVGVPQRQLQLIADEEDARVLALAQAVPAFQSGAEETPRQDVGLTAPDAVALPNLLWPRIERLGQAIAEVALLPLPGSHDQIGQKQAEIIALIAADQRQGGEVVPQVAVDAHVVFENE